MSGPEPDTHLDIEETARTRVHSGFLNVDVIRYHETDSGTQAQREILTGRQAVAVIAHDRERDLLVMIRQFRLAAQMATGKGFCTEVVAGNLDPGEEPEACARRELLEETGLEARSVRPVCRFLTTPGLTDEVIHLFYADVDSTRLPEEAGLASESECTFPVTATLEDTLTSIDDNTLTNGIVMIALLWFARHKETLTA